MADTELIDHTGRTVFRGTQRPPGGGSQPGAAYIVGPYTVGFADIPHAGDTTNLFTIPTDHLLLEWWVDPDTFTAFDSSFAVQIGQGTGFDASANVLGFLDSQSGAADAEVSAAGGSRNDHANTSAFSTLLNPGAAGVPAGPVVALNATPGDLTVGSADLYFLLCTTPAVI